MAASTTYSWWQWSRWLWNIGRNMRITEPTGAELTALRDFLKYIWNPVTQTGTRPWLDDNFKKKAVIPDYECDLDAEPTHVLIELLGVVARNMRDIPVTDSEVVHAAVLVVATGNRRYGTSPYFGGVGGSNVAVP